MVSSNAEKRKPTGVKKRHVKKRRPKVKKSSRGYYYITVGKKRIKIPKGAVVNFNVGTSSVNKGKKAPRAFRQAARRAFPNASNKLLKEQIELLKLELSKLERSNKDINDMKEQKRQEANEAQRKADAEDIKRRLAPRLAIGPGPGLPAIGPGPPPPPKGGPPPPKGGPPPPKGGPPPPKGGPPPPPPIVVVDEGAEIARKARLAEKKLPATWDRMSKEQISSLWSALKREKMVLTKAGKPFKQYAAVNREAIERFLKENPKTMGAIDNVGRGTDRRTNEQRMMDELKARAAMINRNKRIAADKARSDKEAAEEAEAVAAEEAAVEAAKEAAKKPKKPRKKSRRELALARDKARSDTGEGKGEPDEEPTGEPAELPPAAGEDEPEVAEKIMGDGEEAIGEGKNSPAQQWKDGVYKGLSNFQIDYLMKSSYYIGSYHIDTLDDSFQYIDKDVRKYGMIINLDRAGETDKTHWVALFVAPNKEYCYYDPYADKAPYEIAEYIQKVNDMLDPDLYMKYKQNRIVNQSATSFNCGWFCIKFLNDAFRGKSFLEATAERGRILESEEDIEKYKKEMAAKYPAFIHL